MFSLCELGTDCSDCGSYLTCPIAPKTFHIAIPKSSNTINLAHVLGNAIQDHGVKKSSVRITFGFLLKIELCTASNNASSFLTHLEQLLEELVEEEIDRNPTTQETFSLIRIVLISLASSLIVISTFNWLYDKSKKLFLQFKSEKNVKFS